MRTRRSLAFWCATALVAVLSAALAPAGCGGDDIAAATGDGGGGDDATLGPPPPGSPGSGDGGEGGITEGGVLPACGVTGAACATASQCCSNVCDPTTKACAATGISACAAQGAACTSPTACCSLACVGGACAAQCTPDNQACTSGAQCCSGTCGATGTCTPLNTTCKTSGNTCGGNDECCSKLCVGGKCAIASSYCVQNGDVCALATDCCGGNCVKATGATVGTCTAVTGASFCQDGQDGTVCGSCNDCCSRLCAPYALTGVKICQPANGCHVTGDLCRTSNDCCGGDATSGLPGAGNVTCQIDPGNTIGICRNPLSCNPEGNVCHLQNYACDISSARNDCCQHLGAKTDCTPDNLGVPRCHVVGATGGPACRQTGQTCAFDGDCCNGALCVPDGAGHLVCGATGVKCQPTGAFCTVTADCCAGGTCNVPPGSTQGTCGGTTPPPGSDAGVVVNDAGQVTCSQYGQQCSASQACCNGVPCTGGYCVYVF